MQESRASRTRAQPLVLIIWWLALLAATLPITFRQVSVSDAWWHIAIGKWLLAKRSLPDLSHFYFSPFTSSTLASELRWEWFADIAMFVLYAALGPLGLQLLPVCCFLLGALFIKRLGSCGSNPWMIVLFVATSIGTYQLQLPRNSVFSLALYPAVIFLCGKQKGNPSPREFLACSALLLLWSCLHGSCILGWATACAILCARTLGSVAPTRSGLIRGIKPIIAFLLFATASLALVTHGRIGAISLVKSPVEHAMLSVQQISQGASDSVNRGENADPGLTFSALKKWLNSSIWKRDAIVPWSNDYWSPFDILPDMRPIEAAYALAGVAAVCVILLSNVPVGLFLAWLGAIFLGLGYVRMFGYTALASSALVVASLEGRPIWKSRLAQRAGWAVVAFWTGFAWWMFLTQRVETFIPEGQHVSRMGETAIFDKQATEWLKANYPDEKAFTTIETGSYCLLMWDFQKQVFLDGFFGPHTREVWRAYNAALAGDLGALENFGIKTAIIPNTSTQWVDVFVHSPDWWPVAIGQGNIIFAHRSLSLRSKHPEILCTADELKKTSQYFRYAALRTLFLVVSSAGESQGGFSEGEWTGIPAFQDFRNLAREVLPVL